MVSPAAVRNGFLLIVLVEIMWLVAAVVVSGEMAGLTMKLERAFPTNHGVPLSQLRKRDLLRHGRLLKEAGVVDFAVNGSHDPSYVGLYYTRVLLGSPPKEFHVQIDTGSDVLWVSCQGCKSCPNSTELPIKLQVFDPPTASTISCSDQKCPLGYCPTYSNRCRYSFEYEDGGSTSGYYVSDMMHFDTTVGNSITTTSSALVVFGCSTSQTGRFKKSDMVVDGIIGLSRHHLSVISQLASQGVAPNVFFHCLDGGHGGGGTLELAEVIEPNIVYTPLVPSEIHYELDLKSIAINSSVFHTSSTQRTIVDSGTTLAYLAEEAYDPFVEAINQIVRQYDVVPEVSGEEQCYSVTPSTPSIYEIFPSVTLKFAGGASMVLHPRDYLLRQDSANRAVWCIGFQNNQGQDWTILGDLVLKDKIVVYDLADQRIGWANYDCSTKVNVTTSTAGRNASGDELHMLIPITTLISLLYILVFGKFSFCNI